MDIAKARFYLKTRMRGPASLKGIESKIDVLPPTIREDWKANLDSFKRHMAVHAHRGRCWRRAHEAWFITWYRKWESRAA